MLFSDPEEVLILSRRDNAESFFSEIERLSGRYWLAGFISYEAGYLFEKSLETQAVPAFPYAVFCAFREEKDASEYLREFCGQSSSYEISGLKLDIDKEKYIRNIEKIREHIKLGDVYQVNYTTKFRFDFSGSPLSLYKDLRNRQRVSFSAYCRAGDRHIISLSPELFFQSKNGAITVKPMKGTCARGRTAGEDLKKSNYLSRDPKNMSENVMIVDLMRNDLSRVSEYGSVMVRKLFEVEKYNTLYQMTSTVEGKLRPGNGLRSLIKNLFPAGSITGAPKLRSMQIIKSIEEDERKIYTGAIGYITPSGEAVFNVAIRTLLIENGQGEMGVGGGIVYDSEPESEYRECMLKGAFLTDPAPDFSLIETLLLHDGSYSALEMHLSRLRASAGYFGFDYPEERIVSELEDLRHRYSAGRIRVRLLLSREGSVSVSTSVPEEPPEYRLCFSGKITDSSSVYLFHKTTNRALYNSEFAMASARGFYDVVFTNERGEVTEGSRTNVYVERGGMLLTPPLNSGLLGGTVRGNLIASGRAREEVLYPEDLAGGKAFISNALIGIVSAGPVAI